MKSRDARVPLEALSTKSRDARVRLEAPSMRRAQAFVAAVRRSRALHGRWARPPATLKEYRAFVERARQPAHVCRLVLAEDGGLAGVVNINEIVRGAFCSGYLGYYAFVPYNGRGYLREAVCTTVGLAFRRYGLHRLEANIQPENTRSLALVQGLGFRLEGCSPRYLKIAGRWRDHEHWALTREEWKLNPQPLRAGCAAETARTPAARARPGPRRPERRSDRRSGYTE